MYAKMAVIMYHGGSGVVVLYHLKPPYEGHQHSTPLFLLFILFFFFPCERISVLDGFLGGLVFVLLFYLFFFFLPLRGKFFSAACITLLTAYFIHHLFIVHYLTFYLNGCWMS